MKRQLFCQISPLAYQISTAKCCLWRKIKDLTGLQKWAVQKSQELLPFSIYRHNSLIQRKLGNVDMQLQQNKQVNLSLAAPKVTQLLIRPGETFSFWHLVGNPCRKKGYRDGLTISGGKPSKGIGGGMCQFTNLLHWMVLHTPMTIVEHHHHDGVDLFPDFNRQIPFGTGTSILYNYLDYRFTNTTTTTYQLIVFTTDRLLCGEIRADCPQPLKYHIHVENEFFSKEGNDVYRNGTVYRESVDIRTGCILKKEVIRQNHAKVAYDTSHLCIQKTGS